MNQLLLSAVLWLSASVSVAQEFAKEHASQTEQQVRAAFASLVKAAKQANFPSYLSHFDKETFTGLNPDGTVMVSIKDLQQLYAPFFDMIEQYEFLHFAPVVVTIINKQTAILTNEYKAKIKLKSGELLDAAGAGVQVWVKQTDGQWKLVSVSSSNKALK